MTALFVLVVFSTIAAYMVEVGGSQQSTANLSLLEAKVMAAAQSGAEYASKLAENPTCFCSTPPNPPETSTPTLKSGGFANTNVEVTTTCTWNPYQEDTVVYHVYTITSSAVYGAFDSSEHVNRRIIINGNDAADPCPP
ncbi:MAG: hypothetical protein EPN21_02575 [Methylococcaceae bacterium]|nr:MAG: hypothetical protein EPN21_02575 [Methylococcaceae bacterium]